MEETFVMLKPDCVRRKLMGKVIDRIESKGLDVVEMQMLSVPKEIAESHYAEHREKPFFQELVNYVTQGTVVIIRVSGPSAVENIRSLCGATNPVAALPGTIRGDFGSDIGGNIIHASDSKDSAARELSLFFGEAIQE